IFFLLDEYNSFAFRWIFFDPFYNFINSTILKDTFTSEYYYRKKDHMWDHIVWFYEILSASMLKVGAWAPSKSDHRLLFVNIHVYMDEVTGVSLSIAVSSPCEHNYLGYISRSLLQKLGKKSRYFRWHFLIVLYPQYNFHPCSFKSQIPETLTNIQILKFIGLTLYDVLHARCHGLLFTTSVLYHARSIISVSVSHIRLKEVHFVETSDTSVAEVLFLGITSVSIL
ncbi:hypothetical protein ACJX0J_013370, partial [Zea mays]